VLPGQLKIHELSDALVKAAYEMWGPNLAFGDNSTDTFKQQFAAIAKRLAADGQLKGPNNTEIKPEDLKINSGEATPEVATPVLEAETVPPTKKPTIYTEATATAAAPDRHKEMQNLSPEGQADAETKAKAQHLLIPADATDAQIRAIALQAHTLQQQGADVHVGAAKEEHFAAYQKAREQIERLAQGYSLDGSGQIGINGQSTFKPSQAKPISLQQLTSETAAAPIKPLTSSDLTLLAAKEHRQAVANAQLAKEKAAKATIDNDAFLAAIPEDVKLAAKRHQAQEKTPATAEPKTTATAASVLNPRRHAGLAPRM